MEIKPMLLASIKRPAVVAGVVLGAAILAIVIFWPARPRYIYINKTPNHTHDLALKTSLKIAERRSGIENALILLDRLPPNTTIEKAAVDLFRKWDIGRNRQGRGILYLYSRSENKFKIEVSYALEPIFTDAQCGRLERAAQTYMLSDIPQDFLSELIITMNIHGQKNAKNVDVAPSFDPPPWYQKFVLSGGAGVSINGYRPTVEDIKKAVITLSTSTAYREYSPSTNPDTTLQRYLISLSSGIGDPALPLLTEGSKFFRIVVPRNAAQQQRVFDNLRSALPYKWVSSGDFMIAVFEPGHPILPIVMRNSNSGQWYIDEPKSWSYFHRFEDGDNWFPKYDDLPFLPALINLHFPTANNPIYSQRVATPKPRPYPFSLTEELHRQQQRIDAEPGNADRYAEIGEIHLFEMNWLTRALEAFEEASRIAPTRLEFRWRLFDLYINNSQVTEALGQLKTIVKLSPNDKGAKEWLDFYTEIYRTKWNEF